jgi:hypothetical protein
MSENKIFKNKRALAKKTLIDCIDAIMQIPEDRVYYYFDDQEYMQYDQSIEDCYKKKLGFHRYTKNKKRIIGRHPNKIFKIMEKDDCDHFIWISKNICEAEHIKFAWYYAHELQHLIHYVDNPSLCNLSYFLHDTYSGIDRPRWPIEIPIEFDCDQKAKMIVENIFGPNLSDECIKSVFCQQEEYIKFKEIEALMPFNIEKETIRIICGHKDQFKKYTRYTQKYDIDIDGICSK